jgi:anti-sigma regulatory factor (Ser/Thr protein kinase)
VRSEPETLREVRTSLDEWLEAVGVDPLDAATIQVAVGEACTNAIEHAYADNPGANEIVVRFALDDDALSVEVQDWGAGFDAEIEPARDEELRDHAGVGLMLIRSLTDQLTVESGAAGSTVSFAKRLRPPE